MNWRKWNNILHRDIGYLCVGLTIIFAVSGIAVNHIEEWNPSYKVERAPFEINPIPVTTAEDMARKVVRQLNIKDRIESTFRSSPENLKIFFSNHTLEINAQTGEGFHEYIRERFIIHDMNFLHLNYAKKLLTYFSDLYAAALIFLAVSGLFILKGRNGIKGRGAWMTSIGIIIPIIFLMLYKYF
ncbi:MAG: PepSY-associated TM helix domain-containing protein [Calditrichaceae bacterium]